jgi:hypothetical protein
LAQEFEDTILPNCYDFAGVMRPPDHPQSWMRLLVRMRAVRLALEEKGQPAEIVA